MFACISRGCQHVGTGSSLAACSWCHCLALSAADRLAESAPPAPAGGCCAGAGWDAGSSSRTAAGPRRCGAVCHLASNGRPAFKGRLGGGGGGARCSGPTNHYTIGRRGRRRPSLARAAAPRQLTSHSRRRRTSRRFRRRPPVRSRESVRLYRVNSGRWFSHARCRLTLNLQRLSTDGRRRVSQPRRVGTPDTRRLVCRRGRRWVLRSSASHSLIDASTTHQVSY